MRRIIAVIAVLSLLAVACGDDSGSGGPVTTVPADTTTTAPTTTVPGDATTTPGDTTTTTQPQAERSVQI
jgi:hypothetical protein